MPLITLFEHQYRSFVELGTPASHRVWESIEQLNKQEGQELIQVGRNGIRSTEFVGIIRSEDFTFQILPKIDIEGSDSQPGSTSYKNATGSAIQNLLVMLSYAFDLNLSGQNIASINVKKLDWFEVLTRLLATDLHYQLQLGLHQDYRSVEENLPVLRGRWDVNHQLLRHPYNLHTFDVIYDEFSSNTPLNQIFRFVVDELLEQCEDETNKKLITDISEWLSQVTKLTSIPHTMLNQIYFSRLNERFLPAFNLCKLFLMGKSINLTSGSFKVYAFMLDMNLLFERFLTRFIIRHRQLILPISWAGVKIQEQAKGSSYYLARRVVDNRPILHLRPDILFVPLDDQKPVLIADIKYKRINLSHRSVNIAESDLYQILSYSIRMNCNKILLLYPQSTYAIKEEYAFENTNITVIICTVNLHTSLENPMSIIQDLRSVFTFLG